MSKTYLADIEDDNPNVKDRDTDTGNDTDDEKEVDLEELLKTMADDDSEDDEDSEEEESEIDEEEPDSEEEENSEKQKEASITEEEIEARVSSRVQDELNRIIPERVNRAMKPYRELERIAGMTVKQIQDTIIKNMIESTADDMGISEEQARSIVEKDIRLKLHESNQEEANKQGEQIQVEMKRFQYEQDKAKYMKQPKLARVLKEIEGDIDRFAKQGLVLSFEDGMRYVLGEKFTKGELLKKMEQGMEQKTLRNIERRGKATQTKSQGGKVSSTSLSDDQKRMAGFLGVSEKEYAEQLENDKKSKRKSR